MGHMKKILGIVIVFCAVAQVSQAAQTLKEGISRQAGLDDAEWQELHQQAVPILEALNKFKFEPGGDGDALRLKLRNFLGQKDAKAEEFRDCLRQFITVIEQLDEDTEASFHCLPDDIDEHFTRKLLAAIRRLVVIEEELDELEAELDALRPPSASQLPRRPELDEL